MKTLEQCLEGVTAGGKWKADLEHLMTREGNSALILAEFWSRERKMQDAAYAARACAAFPVLVLALDLSLGAMASAYDVDVNLNPAIDRARAALDEALKD